MKIKDTDIVFHGGGRTWDWIVPNYRQLTNIRTEDEIDFWIEVGKDIPECDGAAAVRFRQAQHPDFLPDGWHRTIWRPTCWLYRVKFPSKSEALVYYLTHNETFRKIENFIL